MGTWLMRGDCLKMMRLIPDGTVDAVVTDPPYGIDFMGQKWDYDVPAVEVWAECLRVLKPGGHLLAFAGTRTQHRMAVRIEDAGFEIRDMIAWVYGSGFPKSLDVSKAIDKAAGAVRTEVLREGVRAGTAPDGGVYAKGLNAGFQVRELLAPATPEAREWQGWGTALKPALEPITVARKPLAGTVAANVLQHRTGAFNIDGCRVGGENTRRTNTAEMGYHGGNLAEKYETGSDSGRFPANLIHDGSPEVLAGFPITKPARTSGGKAGRIGYNWRVSAGAPRGGHDDEGGPAARFFYCPKASKADRNDGCDDMDEVWPDAAGFRPNHAEKAEAGEDGNPFGRWSKIKNNHSTVKPTNLMRYLCRLVTPPGGVVLDPFMGSGSTGRGAVLEGFQFIGVEREERYYEIATRRIEAVRHG